MQPFCQCFISQWQRQYELCHMQRMSRGAAYKIYKKLTSQSRNSAAKLYDINVVILQKKIYYRGRCWEKGNQNGLSLMKSKALTLSLDLRACRDKVHQSGHRCRRRPMCPFQRAYLLFPRFSRCNEMTWITGNKQRQNSVKYNSRFQMFSLLLAVYYNVRTTFDSSIDQPDWLIRIQLTICDSFSFFFFCRRPCSQSQWQQQDVWSEPGLAPRNPFS